MHGFGRRWPSLNLQWLHMWRSLAEMLCSFPPLSLLIFLFLDLFALSYVYLYLFFSLFFLKVLLTQHPEGLFCRREEPGSVLHWTSEEALISHWWFWHILTYSIIALLRFLPNSHLSCQSLTWEWNINKGFLVVFNFWFFPYPYSSTTYQFQCGDMNLSI